MWREFYLQKKKKKNEKEMFWQSIVVLLQLSLET